MGIVMNNAIPLQIRYQIPMKMICRNAVTNSLNAKFTIK